MARVDNVNLTVAQSDPVRGSVGRTLGVTADLLFEPEEVAARERFEVSVEIWPYDWPGDPFAEDRQRPPWQLLRWFPPLLRFSWPSATPLPRRSRNYTTVTATDATVLFKASHWVDPRLVDPLQEDPGVTDHHSNPYYPPEPHDDEVFATVRLRSAQSWSASSPAVVVQTGAPVGD